MNKIRKIIKAKETETFKFQPNKAFYEKVGINRKRWGLIFRGEKEPTISELERIADYFNEPITNLLNQK